MGDKSEVQEARLVKIRQRIRAAMQELTKEYDAAFGELEEQKKALDNEIKARMQAQGLKSMKTDFGLVMLKIQTRYETSDWEAFEKFCLERGTIAFLQKRVAQSNMAAFLQENPDAIPPGMNVSSEYIVSIQSPK